MPASAPLGATLSVQFFPHNIKPQPLPTYKGEMDYKVWIYSVNNYFIQTGLTDPIQYAHFALM